MGGDIDPQTEPNGGEVNAALTPQVAGNATFMNFDYNHAHWHGILDLYGMTGDESYKEAVMSVKAYYLDNNNGHYAANPYNYTSERGTAILIEDSAKFAEFLKAIGDPQATGALGSGVLAIAENAYTGLVRADLCVKDAQGRTYPSGCTPPAIGSDGGSGVSRVWGGYYMAGDTVGDYCNNPSVRYRVYQPFMQAEMVEALLQLQQTEGSSWAYSKESGDLAYGIGQFMVDLAFHDDGSGHWYSTPNDGLSDPHGTNAHAVNNGMGYAVYLDVPGVCPSGTIGQYQFSDGNQYDDNQIVFGTQTTAPVWEVLQQVNGALSPAELQRFKMYLQKGGDYSPQSGNHDIGSYGSGAIIERLNNPTGLSLQNIPFTVASTGSGNYNLTFTPPAGSTSLRIKYSTNRQIVDWLGYNNLTGTWQYDPATYTPWFAATAINNPAPTSGTQQTVSIATGQTGLALANFSVKAMAPVNPNAPIISSFTSSPSSITSGQSSTLSFSVSNATSLSIDNGVGTVTGLSSKTVSPTVTTTYTLTATNASGPVSAQVTVTVSTPVLPVISSVSSSAIAQTSASVNWTTNIPTNAKVNYGLSSAYGQSSPLSDTSPMTTSHSLNLSSLSAGTLYHYQVVSTDGLGNLVSSGDNTFTTLPSSVPDTTPPSAIANLSSSGLTQTSAVLSFTSPGNDGNIGTAASYDIRYSTSNIISCSGNTPPPGSNSVCFSSATAATGEPIPQVAGTPQTYTLVGLSANTLYYVAMETSDPAGNISPISNVISFTTLTQVIIPTPTPTPTPVGGGSGGGSGGGGSGGSGSSTPQTPTPPTITNLKATGLDKQVILSWTNPIDVTFVRALVIRKDGSTAPTSSTDGTIIYEGTNNSIIDTGLDNTKTYSYSIFPVLLTGISSTPSLTLTTAPKAGITQSSTPNPNAVVPSAPNPQSSISNLKLVNINGTYYLIISGIRHGITNPGMLNSYGFRLSDAKPATDQDKLLPEGSLLLPGNGSLVKSKEDKTVYLISQGQRYGFVSASVFSSLSASVFSSLGFKFNSVLSVTNPELKALPKALSLINNPKAQHLSGLDILKNKTVYWVGTRQFPSSLPFPECLQQLAYC